MMLNNIKSWKEAVASININDCPIMGCDSSSPSHKACCVPDEFVDCWAEWFNVNKERLV